MVFNTIDQDKLKITLQLKIDKENKFVRKLDNLLLACIIILVTCIILLNVFHPVYGTTLYIVSFAGITISLIPLLYCSIYRIKIISITKKNKQWQKKSKQPDAFTINSDFTITIQIDNHHFYILESITKVDYHSNTPYIINLHGILKDQNNRIESSYELLAIMEQQELLNAFLQLNKELYKMESYYNTTLEKVLHMDNKERSKVFIKELMDAKIFLAINYIEDTEDYFVYPYQQNILLSCYSEKGKLCIFTSINKITTGIKEKYPRGYLISFKEILTFIEQKESSVFQIEQGGIILNPRSDDIEFNSEQIKKLQILKGESTLWQ